VHVSPRCRYSSCPAHGRGLGPAPGPEGARRCVPARRRAAEAFDTITLVWADAGHTGRFVRDARNIWDLAVAIVKRPTQAKGFVLPHHRWVMERSLCATRRSVCIPGSAGRNSEGGSWAG
jgi:hypothetical protein